MNAPIEPAVYTALFPFCGLGAGARGFLTARSSLLGRGASFRLLGGIDNDREACADFETLTGAPALCADIHTLTPAELRAFAGDESPDVVFSSPPCKGMSALLSAEKARLPKYQKLNRLVFDWVKLMLTTWKTPPRLFLLENVPRIVSRGKRFLKAVRKMLKGAGFYLHEGLHDCGELGNLAQHRQRYLMVARHPRRTPPLLYQPAKQRVRACGEVLGDLPLPNDPAAGPLHVMPRLSWLNWVRLALIPAGGDWRDLEGVLASGQARREVHRRHHVGKWEAPAATVAGTGSNGPSAVADPRPTWNSTSLGVRGWEEPSHTVTGNARPSTGAFSVADPRFGNVERVVPWDKPTGTVTTSPAPSSGAIAVADPRLFVHANNPNAHRNKHTVGDWNEPAKTVIGATRPGSGAPSVGDPRPREWFHHAYRVVPWSEPAPAVTGHGSPSGAASVADPRVKSAYDHGYAVLRWDEPSSTIAGGSAAGQGAYSIADVRVTNGRNGTLGVIPWDEAAKTVTGEASVTGGSFAVADPRVPDAPPVMIIRDVTKPPPVVPVIIAADGTWHRPLTTLELAVLQGLPSVLNGKPLQLAGTSVSRWRERIGNAVPEPAARAIAGQMLQVLLSADGDRFTLSSLAVWVRPETIDEVLFGRPPMPPIEARP